MLMLPAHSVNILIRIFVLLRSLPEQILAAFGHDPFSFFGVCFLFVAAPHDDRN